MIKFTQGDIFQSKAQTVTATVNCVGIMGKGLAKEFRQRFPDMYKEYAKICRKGELKKGSFYLYKNLHVQILCFPTKDNWKGPSKYEFIEEGLKTLKRDYKKLGIDSLAIPPLGCGIGGLEWSKVKELIIKYLSDLPIDIEVYEPLEIGDRIVRKNPFRNTEKVKITESTVYTGEIIRIAREEFSPATLIGRLLVQKIAFFSQIAGLPIKLKFKKYQLGPFDYNLNFNIDKLEGIYIRDKSPTLARSDLVMLEEDKWLKEINKLNNKLNLDIENAKERIKRAVDFLKQYSLKETELLASVILAWASLVSSGQAGLEEEVIQYIRDWKYSKFSDDEIKKALKELTEKGWLNPPKPTDDEVNSSEKLSFATTAV